MAAPQISPPPRRRRLPALWRSLLRLNRGYSSVDRAAHGALNFNTVVKLLGWVGLFGIVLVLLQKVREIEDRMDPVKTGLVRLQAEVDRAEVDMGSETTASKRELTSLQDRARQLGQTLVRASSEHRLHGQKSLEEADREAEALAVQLARDEEAAKAVAVQREGAAKALADYATELGLARATLAGEVSSLADGGASTLEAYAGLRHSVADEELALQHSTAPAALDELGKRAAELSARLAGFEGRLAKLEARSAAIPTVRPRSRGRAGAEPKEEGGSADRGAEAEGPEHSKEEGGSADRGAEAARPEHSKEEAKPAPAVGEPAPAP